MKILIKNKSLISILCAISACFCFSLNDVMMKAFSSDYPLYELTLFRSIVALSVCLLIFIPLEGGIRILKTKNLGIHFFRGSCVVIANISFFAGIAVLPLAEATAIFFISPILITIFSIVFLKESVGILRWSALIFGLLGVLLVIKPFGVSFRWEIIFPLTAALAYSSLQILTRYLGVNEKAATMAFYIQISFITYMGIFSIFFHDGNFDIVNHPSFEFFFKGWVWPSKYDLLVICFIGVFNAFGGYLISQAYRLSFAGLIAPFEYSALVFSIFWGIIILGEFLNFLSIIGIFIILVSGVFIAIRETIKDKPLSLKKIVDRR